MQCPMSSYWIILARHTHSIKEGKSTVSDTWYTKRTQVRPRPSPKHNVGQQFPPVLVQRDSFYNYFSHPATVYTTRFLVEPTGQESKCRELRIDCVYRYYKDRLLSANDIRYTSDQTCRMREPFTFECLFLHDEHERILILFLQIGSTVFFPHCFFRSRRKISSRFTDFSSDSKVCSNFRLVV